MENATKALLIAAAVLIAILIISLGIVIFNKASEAIDGAGDLSEYQIQQFNEKFRKYEGTNVSGAEVNALLQTVLNHNNAQESTDTCVKVYEKGKEATPIVAASNEITSTPTKQNVGARYTVTCSINKKSKLIDKIEISVNTDTP